MGNYISDLNYSHDYIFSPTHTHTHTHAHIRMYAHSKTWDGDFT